MEIIRRHFLHGLFTASVAAANSSQSKGSELVRREKFKVLALDGGGVRGFLSAGILANIEQYIDTTTLHPMPLGKRFDLLADTSTGGIIALGLAIGKSANQIKSFYETLIPDIFASSEKTFWRLLYPEFNGVKLKQALDDFFQKKTLKDVVVDVCVTSVSLETGLPRFHKSDYRNGYVGRLDSSLADIALATSAAPTFFPAANIKYSSLLVDGGLCANNPSMVALIDALRFERRSKIGNAAVGNSLKDVMLLSVGTGDQQAALPYSPKSLATAGEIGWAQHVSDVMFQSQSEIAHRQVMALLPIANYYRVNPKLQHVCNLDDADNIGSLQDYMDIDGPGVDFLKNNFIM